jgi:hypothetical protein
MAAALREHARLRAYMVDVLFTVDVEVWCGGWDRLDERFPDAFKRYVYGPTSAGDCALPLKLKILADHGLKGVFFTEPLFTQRFGVEPLGEIVRLILDAKQEVQLHLHTEWVDEAVTPIFPGVKVKRQFMRDFSFDEQSHLLKIGATLLEQSGAPRITAFRAGSFGMGRETLAAVSKAGLKFDSSYNQSRIAAPDNPVPEQFLLQPAKVGDLIEYPMSVIHDGAKYRQLQLGSCSYEEMESALWAAHAAGWQAVVILSHNFELMNQRKDRSDPIVLRRFRKLCKLLDQHRNAFRTVGFADVDERVASQQPLPPRAGGYGKLIRLAEQAMRRLYH